MATRTAPRTREIEGRDSVGLYLDEIARNPLLDAVTEVELSKTIEAGLLAEALLAEGRVGRRKGGAPMSASARGARVARRGGPQGRRHVHHREPAAGRLDRPQVRPGPDADAGPDPGGQHRPDPRGREVRLHQGLQVLDLRHVVGAPGDHPRHRAAGPRRAAARARGRGAQPGRRRPPHPRAPAGPGPRPAGDRHRARDGRRPGARPDGLGPRARQPRLPRRRGRRHLARRPDGAGDHAGPGPQRPRHRVPRPAQRAWSATSTTGPRTSSARATASSTAASTSWPTSATKHGISAERVRQLEREALQKLRRHADPDLAA